MTEDFEVSIDDIVVRNPYHCTDSGMLIMGECLDVMATFPADSIDMILCDLPYGRTRNKWDAIIDIDTMWQRYRRAIKYDGSIVLNATEPFTSKLVMSNIKEYRHKWIWDKNNSAGFANVRFSPFQVCEDILVFGKHKVRYYPIMDVREKVRNHSFSKTAIFNSPNYGLDRTKCKREWASNEYYPKNLLRFSNATQTHKIHPTQKPVALYEYLIKTYTQEGDVVLDNAAGSCTTAIACANTNRRWICIEKELEYCELAKARIEGLI